MLCYQFVRHFKLAIHSHHYQLQQLFTLQITLKRQNKYNYRLTMDSRIYFHQYRRPRYNNPTYASSNVNSSMAFYEDPSRGYYQMQKQQQNYQNQLARSNIGSYSLNKRTEPTDSQRYSTLNNSSMNIPPNDMNLNNIEQQPLRGSSYQRKSHLSSYGSMGLNLNQKDIYAKQNSKFNIITMQPKQFDISIGQHPKFSLQNKDELYYKRMAEEVQKKKLYEESYGKRNQQIRQGKEFIAGKYTYDRQQKDNSQKMKTIEQQYNDKPYDKTQANPQVAQHYQPKQNHHPPKQFTPKLLSHMDQLISLS